MSTDNKNGLFDAGSEEIVSQSKDASLAGVGINILALSKPVAPDTNENVSFRESPLVFKAVNLRRLRLPKLETPDRPDSFVKQTPNNNNVAVDDPCVSIKRSGKKTRGKPYLSLAEAARTCDRTVKQLLERACKGDIKLCFQAPVGIGFFPFDTNSGKRGAPMFTPECLILDTEHCRQIYICNKTEQSDFGKGYTSVLGEHEWLLPSYANPAFERAGCVWRAFSDGYRHHVLISLETILVSKVELQFFIRENPLSAEGSIDKPWYDAVPGEEEIGLLYRAARYFARAYLKMNPDFSGSLLDLAGEVLSDMDKNKVYKRGGEVLPDVRTIRKAFTNVSDLKYAVQKNRNLKPRNRRLTPILDSGKHINK